MKQLTDEKTDTALAGAINGGSPSENNLAPLPQAADPPEVQTAKE
jgi:hypothetical protein